MNTEKRISEVTRVVKLFPFVYTALLLVVSPFEVWLSLKWAELIGLFFFTSVPSAWLCWRLSKAVKLCPWHRVQCIIMLLPLAIPVCRIFVPGSVILVWSGIAVLLVASIVNRCLIDYKDWKKKRKTKKKTLI